jgi:anti-sigma regulatory factor (Ser/Thr protein kinase)
VKGPAEVATVELSFGALPVHVRTARLVAAAIGRRIGVDEALIDELKLAVGEACSRAVNVHRTHAPEEMVVVRFSDADDILTIEVLDSGPLGEQVPPTEDGERASATDLLEPEQLAEPEEDASTQLPSGVGLALIEGLVDDVVVQPRADGHGTSVAMSWPVLPEEIVEDSQQ